METHELLMAILGGGASAALVSGFVQMVIWKLNRKATKEDSEDKSDKHIKTALKLLMHDRIKYLGKCYISEKSIDAEDLRDLMAMHKCYHDDLYGNGFLDSVMAQVKTLPIRK